MHMLPLIHEKERKMCVVPRNYACVPYAFVCVTMCIDASLYFVECNIFLVALSFSLRKAHASTNRD